MPSQTCGARHAGLRHRRDTARPDSIAVTDFVYRRQFAIEWGHCDPAGIVFNARFLRVLRPQHLADVRGRARRSAAGPGRRPTTSSAFRWSARRRSSWRRRRSATWPRSNRGCVNIRRSSFDVEHRMSVKGTLAAEGLETRVWAARHPDDPLRDEGTGDPRRRDREIQELLTCAAMPLSEPPACVTIGAEPYVRHTGTSRAHASELQETERRREQKNR